MAFVAQSYSVGEVLAASKMNQIDTNIDLIRNQHKGSAAPAELVAGVKWIDDTASPWTMKLYDGADHLSWEEIDDTNDRIFHLGSTCDILASGSVSAAATLDVTGLTTTYRAYRIVFDDLLPATDGVGLYLRLSVSGTFQSGASDYVWAWRSQTESAAGTDAGDTDDSEIELNINNCGNVAGAEEISGEILVINPMATGVPTTLIWRMAGKINTGAFVSYHGSGQYQTAGATDGLRLLFSSGNIATMNYTTYGLRAS